MNRMNTGRSSIIFVVATEYCNADRWSDKCRPLPNCSMSAITPFGEIGDTRTGDLNIVLLYRLYLIPTYAVQIAVLCGSIILMSAEGCGCLAEGRGRLYSRFFAVSGQFAAVVELAGELKVVEPHRPAAWTAYSRNCHTAVSDSRRRHFYLVTGIKTKCESNPSYFNCAIEIVLFVCLLTYSVGLPNLQAL